MAVRFERGGIRRVEQRGELARRRCGQGGDVDGRELRCQPIARTLSGDSITQLEYQRDGQRLELLRLIELVVSVDLHQQASEQFTQRGLDLCGRSRSLRR